jgi:hypothetical protein
LPQSAPSRIAIASGAPDSGCPADPPAPVEASFAPLPPLPPEPVEPLAAVDPVALGVGVGADSSLLHARTRQESSDAPIVILAMSIHSPCGLEPRVGLETQGFIESKKVLNPATALVD